jgi:hypothetical protein
MWAGIMVAIRGNRHTVHFPSGQKWTLGDAVEISGSKN